MQPTKDNYPVYEANQVLTNAHLNQSFDYLDEQQRLTRANLIGIGIVCGLTISLDDAALPTAIHVSRGCGITSEGYLIIEPDDLTLTSYRSYAMPEDIAYPSFINSASEQPYPLWELFPDGEPETTALTSPAGFLNDKAVLLFLELKKEELRNCSANNCDDKGAKVTATVRRLLIGKSDLDAIITAAGTLSTEMPDMALQMNLPDLRLPRYDAPATSLSTSNDVLASFLSVFSAKKLAAAVGKALSQAYQAFQPILEDTYESDPFANFAAQFGFLDTAPATVEQARFLPYYYDFFDDLIRAYDEFRNQGAELLCACCPPSGLFPRHLMLGLLFPASDLEARKYRHVFIASAAFSGCETRTQDVVMLFRRLVEMTVRLTLAPLLLPAQAGATDAQIRITPSSLGGVPLSNKAIPYYYLQNGTPPLYQLWNPGLTRQLKANRNQGYHASSYTPAAPAFVTEPLAYDLEPYNFLRIEGHLGKSYQTVLKALLGLKSRYRLPIEIIALRTGLVDDSIEVDINKESCRFQDLEALYATARGETLCLLIKTLIYFYNLSFESASPVTTAAASQFAVVNQFAPGFLVQTNTLGRLFEDYITSQGGTVPEIDANVMASWINIFSPQDSLVYYSFFYIIKLTDALPEDFSGVDFPTLETRFKNLGIVVTAIEKKREQGRGNLDGNTAVLDWEEIDDRLEDLLNTCQSDVLQTLSSEYENRIKALKKKQFLNHFLQEHPGIQHKAGVPVGGTFIVVYHQNPVKTPILEGPQNLTLLGAGVDPMASGVLLPAHTGSANLNDFVFTPILFDFIGAKKPAVNTFPGRAAARIAGTGAADVKTDSAQPASGRTAAASANLSDFVNASGITLNPELFNISPSATTTGTGKVTVNQAILDAIDRLQTQPGAINPDVQLVLEGLNSLIPVLPIIPIFPGVFPPTEADKIIAAAVNGLANGTVIADFYLPYLCCSDCAPIQFVLPKTPPTFSVAIGCTDTTQEIAVAEVTVTVKDGTPPYRLQIDDQDYQELKNPYSLPVGDHTLTVQDADNILSTPQTISIAEPLRIGEPTFVCASDGLTYVATVPIDGGEPPYSVNDVPISGVTFISSAIASGAALKLRIIDRKQCVFETEVTHTCPSPCDLPDDGRSRRCAYRLWLQPALEDEKYGDYKQTTEIKVRFNGTDIGVGETGTLLQIESDALNTDFQNAIGAVVKALNEAVNKGINNTFGALSRPRLTISYEPALTDPFGILWIEHFLSDTFRIEFEFVLEHSLSSGNFGIRYGNEPDATRAPFDGAVFTHVDRDRLETRVPAFACSERNQCDNTDFIELCKDFEVIPDFIFDGTRDNIFTFSISDDMPATGIAAWVWEFTTSTDQPFYVGEKVIVNWKDPGGFVKLTAISDKGCFRVTVEDQR
jgi:hypothetical protein